MTLPSSLCVPGAPVLPPQYLLKTKSMDHNDVPMFFKLFHSGDVHSFRKARLWCLHLLFRSLQVRGVSGMARTVVMRSAPPWAPLSPFTPMAATISLSNPPLLSPPPFQSIHEHNAFSRKHVYSMLMAFHDSLLSDGLTRSLAMKVLARAASLRTHAVARVSGALCCSLGRV